MNVIRVMIVEDSPVVGEHLRRIISADPRFEVAGLARTGEEALAMVERLAPDVITMDIHLPGIQGFEVTRRIMETKPTPIVVVSSIETKEMNLTMEALRAGALAVVEKPVAVNHPDYANFARKLCTQLYIMHDVRVVRQRPFAHRASSLVARPATGPYQLLAIAASTGGPNALMQVLSELGPGFPMPIVILQHMTAAFLPGFAEWLAGVASVRISVVDHPGTLSPGCVYLAASNDYHLVLRGLNAALDRREPVGGHRPSANVLFTSIAASLGPAAIGILLTGMGEDGAAGMLDLKRAGAYTIAEDESTAVVYGMPRAAVSLGAAREALPLSEIAPRVLELIGRSKLS